MPSFVWTRSPEEAFHNPFEYGAQNQFAREATKLLNSFHEILHRKVLRFHRDDQSLAKAVWMLHVDALEALRDSLRMIKSGNHRIAGRLFRDSSETLDLAAYFHDQSPESKIDLAKWYDDEIIPHKKYRDHVMKSQGQSAADEKRDTYKALSKFTHRTYRVLLEGYTLGRDDMLVHDTYRNTRLLVPPQTIAAYFAALASHIFAFSDELVRRQQADAEEIKATWNRCLEKKTVPSKWMIQMPRARSTKK